VTPLTYKILEDGDLIVMLGALRATKRSRKNWNIPLEKFIEMLSDAATIDVDFPFHCFSTWFSMTSNLGS
jgi:hypothetical protein